MDFFSNLNVKASPARTQSPPAQT